MKKLSALLLALLLAASCCVTAAAQETEQESAAQPAAAAATPDEAQAPDVLYGDVDGSGEVNIADATLAQQYVAELVTRDAIGFDAADLDFDDEVTINDVTLIQRYLAEFIPCFDIPKRLTLTPEALRLGVGESVALQASYTQEDGAVRYGSDDPAVATVDENGKVTAVGVGETMITAAAEKKQRAVCRVCVTKAVSAVGLNVSELTMGVGERFTLVKTVAPDEDSYSAGFFSDDPDTVSVDPVSGELTANAVGVTAVSYETYNGVRATCTVTVKKQAQTVILDRSRLLLRPGETFPLHASLPDDEASLVMSFCSSDESVATVDAGGVITAVTDGTATVTATAFGGASAVCDIAVMTGNPTAVTLDQVNVKLGVGDVFPLRATYNGGIPAYDASFVSDKPAVAAVDAQTGVITAGAVGYATVTVKSPNGKTAKCLVTVKNAATQVRFTVDAFHLPVGESAPLTLAPVKSDQAIGSAVYRSSDDAVCTVSPAGTVTAKAVGTAVITAETDGGLSAQVTVTVLQDAGGTVKKTVATTKMRADAAWKAPAKQSVPAGATVRVIDSCFDGRWLNVVYNGVSGWVYNKAFGVKKNYTSITLATLPVVADDLIYDKGADIKNLYNYCQYTLSYRSTAAANTIEEMAVFALSHLYGACYHRASTLYYLLERIGCDVIYVKGKDIWTGGGPHRWVMVKTESGWRHIDPTRVRGLPEYYMVKDSALAYFSWDRTVYPAAV